MWGTRLIVSAAVTIASYACGSRAAGPPASVSGSAPTATSQEPHGWIETETVKTRVGDFEFKGGYPTADAAQRLAEQQIFDRAAQVYLAQIPVVSRYRVWKGVRDAGSGVPNQLVIWDTPTGASTLLLTSDAQTVCALAALDLKRDGPIVVEVPAALLVGVNDLSQGDLFSIGALGADKGRGAKLLLLPPDDTGAPPAGYLAKKSRTFSALLDVRGSLVDGKPAKAVALMKLLKIYPLTKAAHQGEMTVVNGSGLEIDTTFADNGQFFDDLGRVVEREPADLFSANERLDVATIGMQHGTLFTPDTARMQLLAAAARYGSAIARANAYASADPDRLAYPGSGNGNGCSSPVVPARDVKYRNIERRTAFAYTAIGMSPAMVPRVVEAGSRHYWTVRDAAGEYLEGGKRYRLHLPANIPVKDGWSVLAYDAESRSLVRNGDKIPTVSLYTSPEINADTSVDVYFGPEAPAGHEKNWIRTVDGKGWFAVLQFSGPLQPLFDKSWKPGDIEIVN